MNDVHQETTEALQWLKEQIMEVQPSQEKTWEVLNQIANDVLELIVNQNVESGGEEGFVTSELAREAVAHHEELIQEFSLLLKKVQNPHFGSFSDYGIW